MRTYKGGNATSNINGDCEKLSLCSGEAWKNISGEKFTLAEHTKVFDNTGGKQSDGIYRYD